MCTNCGCSVVEGAVLHIQAHPDHAPAHHSITHSHSHSHRHGSGLELEVEPELEQTHDHPKPPHTLTVHERLLVKNDRFAQQNRQQLQDLNLFTLNVLSSPGSGKTTLIEVMARQLSDRGQRLGAIVGDLATENDAQRLRAAGAVALQITTGTACHLEGDMVAHALAHLDLQALDWLVIENVGNLVCPAAYDLGETLRVVLLSVTEGEDKPLKYPTAFQSADVVILSKIELAETVGFDLKTALTHIHRMAPHAPVFQLSARTGAGMDDWLAYLDRRKQTLEVLP